MAFLQQPVKDASSGRAGASAHGLTEAILSPSPSRVPPGQILTTKWPVLHYGNVPRVDTTNWTFMVSGLVDRPFAIT